MKLIKARVKCYRSIIDSGYFDIEKLKTIFVGPNEAGKTAILQALQKLNPTDDVPPYNPLRDYPRSKYDYDIQCGNINIDSFSFVEGHFALSEDELFEMPKGFENITFVYGRYLNNKKWWQINNGVSKFPYSAIEKDIKRLCANIEENFLQKSNNTKNKPPKDELDAIVINLNSNSIVDVSVADNILKWLDTYYIYLSENEDEEARYDRLKEKLQIPKTRMDVLQKCESLLPKFILFNNYFRVRPSIHLEHLALRTEKNLLDDSQYDYGNLCLLKMLGFTARELSDAGKTQPANQTPEEVQKYKDILDVRDIRINSANIRLTQEIKQVWNPNPGKSEANSLKLKVDGQYLKVVVEDSLGVEVELDQRSEGFQWLVSFFVVFFSESMDKHKNAILLLDEPGLSLHGLKQAEFRETLSRLSEKNQTIFTTHSPFLVGANELDIVRVVEMITREEGTIVHTSVTASDSAALLPLQEALGYDLAQNLFIHQKNLILEGLTDYWYVEALSELTTTAKVISMDEKISMLPANCASKVVYYATILHAQNLKVAALLDSDAEGDLAAQQDTLVNALGNKKILRTKDVYNGNVPNPEIEDLLRESLVKIAKDLLGWDIEDIANKQNKRPIVDVFASQYKTSFSKYQLAKAFLRWARDNDFYNLTKTEQEYAKKLIDKINKSLK